MNRYQIYLEKLSLSSSISGRIPVNRRSRADHPIAVRSLERCEGVNPLTPASQGLIAKSGFGVCGGKRSLPFEIANSDFPIQSGPLIERRDTWYRTSGFRGSALGNSRCKGLTTREFAISRIPIAGGDPTSSNPCTSTYRSSGLRGFQYREPLVFWIRDPRNPEEDVARWVPKT